MQNKILHNKDKLKYKTHIQQYVIRIINKLYKDQLIILENILFQKYLPHKTTVPRNLIINSVK